MNEINVEQFEYKTAQAPNILYSGGLGPCIAMGAIYGKKGYMFHTPSLDHTPELLDSMIADLNREVADKRELSVYIAGGEINPEDEETFVDIRNCRKTLIERLEKEGLTKNIRKLRWNPTNHIQNLKLLLSKGKGIIEEFNHSDGDSYTEY